MQIKTPRLRMSPLVMGDLDAFHAYRSLPEVARYQGFAPTALEDSRAFIARQTHPWDTPDTWSQLAVRHGESVVGDVGVHFRGDGQQCAFGVTLAPKHQGQGFATEAVRALLDHLFGALHKHRVVASVDPRNTPSVRLMQRLGLRQEAHHIASCFDGQAWTDDLVFAVLRREWPR